MTVKTIGEKELVKEAYETVDFSGPPPLPKEYATLNKIPLKEIYRPEDIAHIDYKRDIGDPGETPMTRGNYPTMYRGRLWNIRELSGQNTVEFTNKRLRFLYNAGQKNFCLITDMATQFQGLNPLDPRVVDEIGLSGCVIQSMDEYKIVFQDIPRDEINLTLVYLPYVMPVHAAMYFSSLEEDGIDFRPLYGNSSNDPAWPYAWAPALDPIPPRYSYKVVGDYAEWVIQNMPHWHTNLCQCFAWRSMGANIYQEMAFGFTNQMTFIDEVLSRGTVTPDQIFPRVNFNISVGIDFFEEVAKLRASRRIWHKIAKERYGCQDPASWKLRFQGFTDSFLTTREEPWNNLMRNAIMALAAVLGGAPSMHVNGPDEPLNTPLEETALLALRTQQIIAYESRVTYVADPLGGSYYVEWLTNEVEKRIWEKINEIDAQGGFINALEKGWIAEELRRSQLDFQRRRDSREIVQIGSNAYRLETEPVFLPAIYEPRVDLTVEEVERKRQEQIIKNRDNARVKEALEGVRKACEQGINIMPSLFVAAKVRAMAWEVVAVFREVWGIWQPTFSMY